jgi:DNA repair protein RadC
VCSSDLCLDIKSKLNNAVLVHEGTLNEVPVYPRLIVEAALTYNAATVILAHNHPGGTLAPSEGDKEVTKKIKDALKAISIHMADHIIVAGNKYFSFSENGVIV